MPLKGSGRMRLGCEGRMPMETTFVLLQKVSFFLDGSVGIFYVGGSTNETKGKLIRSGEKKMYHEVKSESARASSLGENFSL